MLAQIYFLKSFQKVILKILNLLIFLKKFKIFKLELFLDDIYLSEKVKILKISHSEFFMPCLIFYENAYFEIHVPESSSLSLILI